MHAMARPDHNRTRKSAGSGELRKGFGGGILVGIRLSLSGVDVHPQAAGAEGLDLLAGLRLEGGAAVVNR